MGRPLRQAGQVLLWLVTALEAFGIGAPGLTKFFGHQWQQLFVGWGYPSWFSYVIGVIEVVGAGALVVPQVASYAALLLVADMAGAALTLLTHRGPMGWATPFVDLVLLTIIAIGRWGSRTGATKADGGA